MWLVQHLSVQLPSLGTDASRGRHSHQLALLLAVPGVEFDRSVSAQHHPGSRHLESELVLLARKLTGGRDLRAQT